MVTAPERPPPGIQSIEDRRQMARRLIIHAREELQKGHRLQAGEKAWGAVVHPLKGIAEQRGWNSDNYQISGMLVVKWRRNSATRNQPPNWEKQLPGHLMSGT